MESVVLCAMMVILCGYPTLQADDLFEMYPRYMTLKTNLVSGEKGLLAKDMQIALIRKEAEEPKMGKLHY